MCPLDTSDGSVFSYSPCRVPCMVAFEMMLWPAMWSNEESFRRFTVGSKGSCLPARESICCITCQVYVRNKRCWGVSVNTASKIIGRSRPNLESLYQQRLLRRAGLISQDPSHPAHDLFEPLPSSRRFRSIKTRTSRFSNSFIP